MQDFLFGVLWIITSLGAVLAVAISVAAYKHADDAIRIAKQKQ